MTDQIDFSDEVIGERMDLGELEALEKMVQAAPVLYGFFGADGWYFYPRKRPAPGDTHKCRVVMIEELPKK